MNNLIQELKRRKVFRVAGMYALVAWIIMQIGEVTFPALLLPDWSLTLVIVLLIIGFPIAIILAWAFDITPEGIKRDRSPTTGESSKLVSTYFSPNPKKPESHVLRLSIAFAALVTLAAASWLILPQIGLFELQATPDANSLAVLNFENLQDPEDKDRLGQILQELIITDLSQLGSFKVFSSQRLYDLQNQLGYSESRDIDPSVALNVARMAGAATMLTGNIIRTGGKIILTSRLIEVDRGTVLKSQRVEGQDIYAMVDRLTNLVRTDLNLTATAAKEIKIPVIEKTTGSMTAYQHYLEGMELFNEQKFSEAIEHFQNALTVDTGFTDVYYPLAMAQWWAQSISNEITSEDALATLNEIITGRHYKTTKEKLLAEGAWELVQQNYKDAAVLYEQLVGFLPDEKDGWYGLGEALFHGYEDYDRAKDAFERVLELDPSYKLAYRHIFDIYNARDQYSAGMMVAIQFVDLFPESAWGPFYLGMMNNGMARYEKAAELYIEAIIIDPNFTQAYSNLRKLCQKNLDDEHCLLYTSQLIDAHPDNPATYRLQGHIYRNAGDYSAAIRSYQKGLEVDPQYKALIASIGYTYQLMGLYETARDEFQKLMDLEDAADLNLAGQKLLCNLYMEQGKFHQAIECRNQQISGTQNSHRQRINLLAEKALIFFLTDDFSDAHATLDQALNLDPRTEERLNLYLLRGMLAVREKDADRISQLLEIVAGMRTDTADDSSKNLTSLVYNSLTFQYYFLKEEFEAALQAYEHIAAVDEIANFFLYQKALLHYKAGDYDKALATAEEMQSPLINSDARPFVYPRSFYITGMVYETLGNLTLARQNYQKLLSIWYTADENIPIRRELLQRLMELNQATG